MAYYLQMDGVDDKIQTPSITFNEIIIDFSSTYVSARYIIDARSGISNGYTYWDTVADKMRTYFNEYYVNGIKGTTENMGISSDQRVTVRLVNTTSGTDNVSIFSQNNGFSVATGNFYSIKFLNNSALVAHYDPSQQSPNQTLTDLSGNGNHATLTGGTWVDDGTGGTPTGKPVTYDYDILNQVYADRTTTYDLKQSIYVDRVNDYALLNQIFANRQSDYDSNQSMYANRTNNYDIIQQLYEQQSITFNTEQVIYKTVSSLFDTLQQITSSGIPVSVKFDMLMSIYADRQESYDTVQSYFKDVSLQADLKQAIYKLTQTDNLLDVIIFANRTYDNDTKQTISSAIQQEFDTLQQMYQSTSENYDVRNEIYRNESIDADTKQIIYKLDQMEYALKQAMYKSVSVDFDTLQKMLSDYKEYRQVIEYVLQISRGKQYDLNITTRKEFDFKI